MPKLSVLSALVTISYLIEGFVSSLRCLHILHLQLSSWFSLLGLLLGSFLDDHQRRQRSLSFDMRRRRKLVETLPPGSKIWIVVSEMK